MPARDYYLKSKRHGQLPEGHLGATLCQREQRPTHAHRCAGLACGARSSPWGGWLREARRWVCCGLRRTGGSSPGCRFGFGARFIIAVHHAFVLGLGARHGGIVELSEGS